MRWALMMMRLWATCRNTSVRRTTGTAPDAMRSASTWPGPTEGSWSMSPTIKRAALSGTAFKSACISMTSTMEASSTTSRSQSSGLSSPRLKPPPLGSTSSSRWMVLASNPVASVMRLAARPVGAQSKSLTPLAARMRRIALTMVVLPTPGPPVMTRALDISASRIAATWLSARIIPMRFSTHGNAFSGSIHGQGSVPFIDRGSARANPTRMSPRTLVCLVDQSHDPRAVVDADRWRRAPPPVIERITHCGESGRGDVGAQESFVSLGGGELYDAVLHCKDGVAAGYLPLTISAVTGEAIADLDGTKNAARGAQHHRSVVLDRTFMR